ncbi:MAG: cupin domain-containing protein [Pirellulales bacterium]|nr:cupin domain-containing protein [Pirellulales bacterium]
MNRNLLPWSLCALLVAVLAVQNLDRTSLWLTSSADAAEVSLTGAFVDPLPIYEAEELVKKRADRGRAYLPFLDVATMDLGIYSLPKGGTDGQSPHDKDEIYYVLAGKAKIRIKGTAHDVKEGSIIFVAAGDEHRFEDIQEDLDLLVFFSKAKPARN